MDDYVLLFSRGKNHVLNKFNVRRGCTVPSQLTWPSTKKSSGTEKFVTTRSVMVAMSCQRPSLSGPAFAWTPHMFYLWGYPFPIRAAIEWPEFDIKPSLGIPLLIFSCGHLLKSFPHVGTSASQRVFEIIVFPLLGELPKAIEPQLPICQLYRW